MDEEQLQQETGGVAEQQQQFQAPQQTEAQQQAQDRLRQLLEAQGIEVGEDVNDAARSIAESIKARKDAEERARKREEELLLYQQELDRLRQQSTSKQEPPPAQKKKRWDAVDIPEQYMALIKQDRSSGQWIPKEGLGPAAFEAARYVNEAMQERQRRADRLLSNPVETLRDAGLDDLLEERLQNVLSGFEEKIKSSLMAQQEKQRQDQELAAIQEFREQNKAALFELDQSGNPKLDSRGALKLTAVGKAFQAELEDAMKNEVNPIYAMRAALRLAKAEVKNEPPPPDKKETFTERARQSASSGQRKPSVIREESQDDTPATSFIEFAMRDPEYRRIMAQG